MMLNSQAELIKYCKNVNDILTETNNDLTSLNIITDSIQNQELFVPIIGSFSSGKTSLINKFLGKSILPTAITPETSLATELRYTEKDNYIEAIDKDENFEKFPLENFETIKNNSKNYKYIKVYINNKHLKKIQPLIIVDMPGFDSPINSHNEAIMDYLDKGVYFIVLSSIEDGSLTESILRELDNITRVNKQFTICVSKTDMRPENDTLEIQKYIEGQLDDYLGIKKNSFLLGTNAPTSLELILSEIDTEQIFDDLYTDILKDNFFSQQENLNVQISTIKQSKQETERQIQALQNSINSLVTEKEAIIADTKNKYGKHTVDTIINSVVSEMCHNEARLISLLDNESEFSHEISSIIRNVLIKELEYEFGKVREDITHALTSQITQSLNLSKESTLLDTTWIEKIQNMTNETISLLNKINNTTISKNNDNSDNSDRKDNSDNSDRKDNSNKKDSFNYYKIITGSLAILTNVINPTIELFLLFLPEILRLFTDSYQDKFHTEIIPGIKTKLRSELPSIINEQLNVLIENISDRIENDIKVKRDLMIETISHNKGKVDDENRKLDTLENKSTQLNLVANKILFTKQ